MYRLVFRCIEINTHVSVRLKEQIGYSQNESLKPSSIISIDWPS